MKLRKIYSTTISELLKGGLIYAGELDKENFITLFNHLIILIKKYDFFLDMEKLEKKDNLPMDLNDLSAHEDADIVKIKRNTPQGTLMKLASKNHSAYIQSKYLGFFDDDCQLKIADNRKYVLVYEDEELVGIIGTVIVDE